MAIGGHPAPDDEVPGHDLTYMAMHGLVRPPAMPPTLRVTGRIRWHEDAELSLGYARAALTGEGDLVVAAGNLARGVIEEAHSRSCARGEWVINEKGLAERAGLGVVAAALARRSADGIHDALDRLADELVHALV